MALNLPRLIKTLPIVDSNTGQPDYAFMQWMDQFAKEIEKSVEDILQAQSTANYAKTTAESAQDTAKLSNSGTDNLTITSTDAGSDASVTISAHTRLYSDGTSVSVDSGSITGLSYSTLYYIYYQDSSFAGGAVTYQTTTDMATAAQAGDTHLVGSVTTAASGGVDTGGGVLGPPGTGDLNEP